MEACCTGIVVFEEQRICDTTWDLWPMISLIHVRSAVTWGYFLSSFAFAGSTDNLDSSLLFFMASHSTVCRM